MPRSKIVSLLALIIFYLLQNFFISLGFPFWPPLLIVVVVYCALYEEFWFGITVGVFAGLLLEPMAAGRIGGESFALAITALLCSRLSGPFFRDSIFTRVFLPCMAFYFSTVIRIVWYKYFSGSLFSARGVFYTLLPETILVLFLSPFIFSLLNRWTGRQKPGWR